MYRKTQNPLTCMQAFGDSGRIYEVSLAYLARDVRVERLQLDAPLHSHHRITGSTLYIIAGARGAGGRRKGPGGGVPSGCTSAAHRARQSPHHD